MPKDCRAAFEFRHQSWFDSEVFDLLRAHQAVLCIAEAEKTKPADKYTLERLKALNDFFAQTSMFYAQVRAWPAATIAKLAKLGQAVVKLVGG